MPISALLVNDTPTLKRWSITATLAADLNITIPHGMEDLPGYNSAELVILMTWKNSAARAALWFAILDVVDQTTVILTKATGIGSGDGSPQLDLTVMLPHSIL